MDNLFKQSIVGKEIAEFISSDEWAVEKAKSEKIKKDTRGMDEHQIEAYCFNLVRNDLNPRQGLLNNIHKLLANNPKVQIDDVYIVLVISLRQELAKNIPA